MLRYYWLYLIEQLQSPLLCSRVVLLRTYLERQLSIDKESLGIDGLARDDLWIGL